MYNRSFWKDHIVDSDTGEVLQQGTLQDAEHFNNMEEGIFAANEQASANSEMLAKHQREVESLEGEMITVTLTNTQGYPFNNSKKTIALSHKKSSTTYKIQAEVESYSGGGVGDIQISEKLLNGFKVEYTGAAKSVTLKLFVSGGE